MSYQKFLGALHLPLGCGVANKISFESNQPVAVSCVPLGTLSIQHHQKFGRQRNRSQVAAVALQFQ